MKKIFWTKSALKSLDKIYDFIAEDSPLFASAFINRIIDALDQVKDFPLSGRVVPEFKERYFREIIVGNYRIMYEIDGQVVYVVTIIHGAREYKR